MDEEPRLCALTVRLGHAEACPGAACAFWDQGGAVIEGRCALERLGIDPMNLDLVQYLTDLRAALETVRPQRPPAG